MYYYINLFMQQSNIKNPTTILPKNQVKSYILYEVTPTSPNCIRIKSIRWMGLIANGGP